MKLTARYWLMMVVFSGLLACTSTSESPGTKGNDDEKMALARVDAAKAYLASNNLEAAKRHLDKAMSYSSKNSEVNRILAHYYDRVGELVLAEKHFKTAISQDRKNGEALSDYGVFLCRKKQFEAAQDLFADAVAIPSYPNVAGTLENSALCYQRSGNADKAEDLFMRALRHNPKQSGALLEMAIIELARQRNERAKAYYLRHVDAGGSGARSLYTGIRINHLFGDKNAVASLGLKLERMYPDAEETLLYLDNKAKWRK